MKMHYSNRRKPKKLILLLSNLTLHLTIKMLRIKLLLGVLHLVIFILLFGKVKTLLIKTLKNIVRNQLLELSINVVTKNVYAIVIDGDR